MALQHKDTHRMVKFVLGYPLDYRCTNNTNPQIKIWKILREILKINTSSNKTYLWHVAYAHPTKMTHASTCYHVALINI